MEHGGVRGADHLLDRFAHLLLKLRNPMALLVGQGAMARELLRREEGEDVHVRASSPHIQGSAPPREMTTRRPSRSGNSRTAQRIKGTQYRSSKPTSPVNGPTSTGPRCLARRPT